MSDQLYYLRPTTVLEPLVCNWFAHPFLLSPATFSLVIRERIALMRSFLEQPELHEMATKDSSVVGRTFLNKPASEAGRIRALMEKTLLEENAALEFAQGITQLNGLLQKEAKGFSLEGLYKEVPGPLKGFVELLYDVNNRPGMRFFESLLHKASFYSNGNQSVFLYEMDPVVRGNILDTPRLPDERSYLFQVPLQSEVIDRIARTREEPATRDAIVSWLGKDVEGLFDRLFVRAEEYPEKPEDTAYHGDGIRIRYYGHACVLVQTSEVSVLIDPFVNYAAEQCETNYTLRDLPDLIDYVLITHNHVDHIVPEYLLQLRYKVRHIVVPRNGNGNLEDPSLKLLLRGIGFSNVLELDELDSIKIPGGEIIGLPFLGEHCDLSIRSKILHLVKLKGRSVLLASDSSNLEIRVYKLLRSIVGEVDIVFLGMESEGAPLSLNYAPFMMQTLSWKMDQSRRVNGSGFDSGFAIVHEFNPSAVYVYAMGIEPWTRYILGIKYTEESIQLQEAQKLIDACLLNNIHAELLQSKREIILPAAIPETVA